TGALEMQLRWMTRVLDVQAAIESRGFAPELRGQLVIEVRDDLLEAQSGAYTVKIEGGAARVERGGTPELKVGVGALASLYTGHLAAEELAMLGTADGAPDDLARATALFSGPAPWLPEIY